MDETAAGRVSDHDIGECPKQSDFSIDRKRSDDAAAASSIPRKYI